MVTHKPSTGIGASERVVEDFSAAEVQELSERASAAAQNLTGGCQRNEQEAVNERSLPSLCASAMLTSLYVALVMVCTYYCPAIHSEHV